MADLVKTPKPVADDAAFAARVGSVVRGKWTLDRLLGVGGMAAVFAASHRNGQKAALKILHAEFAKERPICERFLREAYVSNKVNHSATVQVLDDDVTDQGEPFLIMELLLGETVRDAWKRSGRTMAVGRVLQICERVLDCLASCHAIGVIHRDLKPANIFITEENEIKVLDFGVAQMRDATSEKTAAGTALGTPAYMSPEQAMGLVDQLDGRADLFSVGAMMHALISGHRINNGRTEQEALVMAATKPVPSVARIAPDLAPSLIKVIDRSLSWDRRNRFQNAREFQRTLLELMIPEQTMPLVSKPPPRPLEVVAPPPPSIPPELLQLAAMGSPLSGVAEAAPGPRHASTKMPTTSQPSSVRPKAAHAGTLAYDPLLGEEPPPEVDAPPSGLGKVAAPEEPSVSDPRVTTLRDLMRHWDRLFPSVRQFGWSHPATERALRTLHDAFAAALKSDPHVARFTLRPYSLMTAGQTVWEPATPFDAIPYNLFACGMRELRIEAGIDFEEMRDFLTMVLLDPGRDLPPEDDLVAALWEKNLKHVAWACADAFAEGDAAEREAFYDEADRIEVLAKQAEGDKVNLLEVKAMTLSTDGDALGKERVASPFALDARSREKLAEGLTLERASWTERYVHALVEGYLDAVEQGDAPLVLGSLRRSASDLAVAGRIDVAVELRAALIARIHERVEDEDERSGLSATLSQAMFGGEALAIVLARLRQDAATFPVFAPILETLGPSEFTTVLTALRDTANADVRRALVAFVERFLQGREGDVAAAAKGTDPDTAASLLGILSRSDMKAAKNAVAELAESDEPALRFEARYLSTPSPGKAEAELAGAVENAAPIARMAALRTVVRHQLKGVWPVVSRAIGAKNFHDLGCDERRELLRACVILAPERGEAILLELVKKGGVLNSGNREETRGIAAELLGEHARSRSILSVLHDVSQSRWGASEETRSAAARAASRMGERLAGTGP